MIQQRILNGRDHILQNPQIVKEVLEACDDKKLQLEQIQNEIQSIKAQLSELKVNDEHNGNIIESGVLNLSSTWTHYGGGYKQAKWFKIGKMVVLQGLVRSKEFASQNHMATLPKNCCPKQQLIFSLDQHGVSFRVDILINGQINWVRGSNTYNWISLSGVVFVVE